MAVLAVLVQSWPERTATILADVFMELLLNRDDYLRALRSVLVGSGFFKMFLFIRTIFHYF